MGTNSRNQWALPATVGVLVGLALIWILWKSFDQQPDAPRQALAQDDLPAEIVQVREQAYALAGEQKWCDARDRWQQVRDAVAGETQLAHVLEEAERNLRFTNPLCSADPADPRQKSATIFRPQDADPATMAARQLPADRTVAAEDLIKYYRPDRHIRSIGILQISGRGTNRRWLIRGDASFQYFYQVPVETKVQSNDGTTVVIEQTFGEVSQNLVVSAKELQLDLPDSPLLYAGFRLLEGTVLRRVPYYVVGRVASRVWLFVDPNGKETLTAFGQLLEKAGVALDGSEEVEFLRQVEKLSGATIQFTYDRRFGVTQVDVGEELFTASELERIALNSSLMMDYFIFPATDRQVGDSWTVKSRDVAGLINLGYDVEINGQMTLERRKSTQSEVALVAVTDGRLDLTGFTDGGEQSANVDVRVGTIDYSLNDLMTRRADLEFDAKSLWTSRDHLLFGTEKIRNLHVQARYEAEVP